MSLRRTLSPVLLFALLLAHLGVGVAAGEETRWYDVEVLLFVQKSQDYRESERWPVDYTLPDLENARELLAPSAGETESPANAQGGATASTPAQPQPFRLLSGEELQLGADAERIERASDIELLLHLGWRQPGLPEDQSVAVRIHSDMLHRAEASAVNEAAAAGTASQPANGMPGSALQGLASDEPPPRLEGTLRLILSRYLHIEADLLYREPLEGIGASDRGEPLLGRGDTMPAGDGMLVQEQDLFLLAEQAMQLQPQPQYRVYRLQQSRRMRSNELHYLDHPVFGMAIKVTPYELPEPEAQPAAGETTPQG